MNMLLAIFFGMPGWLEITVLLGVGVLIFGRRLPEVGHNIGRGIIEFKKGLRGIEDDIEDAVETDTPPKQVGKEAPSSTSTQPNQESQVASEQQSDTKP